MNIGAMGSGEKPPKRAEESPMMSSLTGCAEWPWWWWPLGPWARSV